jgi:hypothetical protein
MGIQILMERFELHDRRHQEAAGGWIELGKQKALYCAANRHRLKDLTTRKGARK